MPTTVTVTPDIMGIREQIKENIAFALGPDNRYRECQYVAPPHLNITTSYTNHRYTASVTFLPYSDRPIVTSYPCNTPVEALEDLFSMSSLVVSVMREARSTAAEPDHLRWMDVVVKFAALPEKEREEMKADLVERGMACGLVLTKEQGMEAFREGER